MEFEPCGRGLFQKFFWPNFLYFKYLLYSFLYVALNSYAQEN